MEPTNLAKTILLIEDDVSIRVVLRRLLFGILLEAKVHTSDKGIEGLGLAYVLKPDIIILDTTLPKYSGREIIEYITTNKSFEMTQVIILHEDRDVSGLQNLGPNYYVLPKKGRDFPADLLEIVKANTKHGEEGKLYLLAVQIAKKVILHANLSDINVKLAGSYRSIFADLVNTCAFIFNQLMTSLYLTVFIVLMRRRRIRFHDKDIPDQGEFKAYRTRVYPTVALGVIVLIITGTVLWQLGRLLDYLTP